MQSGVDVSGIQDRLGAEHVELRGYEEEEEIDHSPKPPNKKKGAIRTLHDNLYPYAKRMVLPRNQHHDEVDAEIENEYLLFRPPVTILLVSLTEIAVFLYYVHMYGEKLPMQSPLIYNPKRRYEAWRFFSYMLIHAGYMHIIFNIFIQLVLGIALEMVHMYWRVWLVYISGVIAGSLGTSIADPMVYLAGASSGVYALITAHIATIILNFKQMEYPKIQLSGFLLLLTLDTGVAIYGRYVTKDPHDVTGYAAHFAGGVAGLLMGIVALRNLEEHKWEKILQWLCLITYVVLMAAMIIWNVAIPSYFLPSE